MTALATRIGDCLQQQAATRPMSEALVWTAQTGSRKSLSYRDLSDQVDGVAAALLATGVRRGDRIAMLGPPCPEFLITLLGAARIGAVWVGLNPRYTLEELRFIVGNARPKVLFSIVEFEGRQYLPDLSALADEVSETLIVLISHGQAGPWPHFDQFRAAGASPRELAEAAALVCSRDPAIIVYTSGTTGRPKGALLPHDGIVECFSAQYEHMPASPLRILNNLPVNHIGSVGDISLYALLAGGTVVLTPRFGASRSLELIERERITVWGQVPTMFQLSLDSPGAEKRDLSSLQVVFWSGAPAPLDLVARLRTLGARLYNAYGLTETVSNFTYTTEAADDDVLTRTIGHPDRRYEVRLAAADGQAVAPGEVGEILVRSPFLMLGYFEDEPATRATIDADGWLRTGDLALERPDGNLALVGRAKEMFKSGGYNIYPREIELVLESHPAVELAAVVSVPDPLYYEVGCAFVMQNREAALTAEVLQQHCRTRLANYKIPKYFMIEDKLPMLPIGKVDKPGLRRRAAELAGAESPVKRHQ